MTLSGEAEKRFAKFSSQSGAGVQSSSVNARNWPFALRAPVLRAFPGPPCFCLYSLILIMLLSKRSLELHYLLRIHAK